MKAKTIILLIVNALFLVGGTGCEKENGKELEKLILGNWLLVEKNISDGTPFEF